MSRYGPECQGWPYHSFLLQKFNTSCSRYAVVIIEGYKTYDILSHSLDFAEETENNLIFITECICTYMYQFQEGIHTCIFHVTVLYKKKKLPSF